jgi:hypothetical protein
VAGVGSAGWGANASHLSRAADHGAGGAALCRAAPQILPPVKHRALRGFLSGTPNVTRRSLTRRAQDGRGLTETTRANEGLEVCLPSGCVRLRGWAARALW